MVVRVGLPGWFILHRTLHTRCRDVYTHTARSTHAVTPVGSAPACRTTLRLRTCLPYVRSATTGYFVLVLRLVAFLHARLIPFTHAHAPQVGYAHTAFTGLLPHTARSLPPPFVGSFTDARLPTTRIPLHLRYRLVLFFWFVPASSTFLPLHTRYGWFVALRIRLVAHTRLWLPLVLPGYRHSPGLRSASSGSAYTGYTRFTHLVDSRLFRCTLGYTRIRFAVGCRYTFCLRLRYTHTRLLPTTLLPHTTRSRHLRLHHTPLWMRLVTAPSPRTIRLPPLRTVTLRFVTHRSGSYLPVTFATFYVRLRLTPPRALPLRICHAVRFYGSATVRLYRLPVVYRVTVPLVTPLRVLPATRITYRGLCLVRSARYLLRLRTVVTRFAFSRLPLVLPDTFPTAFFTRTRSRFTRGCRLITFAV